MTAFADQHEPLAAWQRALRGEAGYELTFRIAHEAGTIAAGIAFERYPRSACGLVTYMVVAPEARQRGLGKRLLDDAVADLRSRGAVAVFGEVNDPRRERGHETADIAWTRLERNQRWGARVANIRYLQPALGAELERDRGLCLLVLDARDQTIAGATIKTFMRELFEVTEQTAPDEELREILDAIPERVPLVELAR
ncbi:MAG: hypothetical protein JWO36_4434 [Myxococcales bacterium]|nr:hypothetical protein [Myxococcales bacterium]